MKKILFSVFLACCLLVFGLVSAAMVTNPKIYLNSTDFLKNE
jgi:hypothetical protein